MNNISPECIESFMSNGWGIVENWLEDEDRRNVLKEIEYLNHDCKFEDVYHQAMHGTRTDKACWLSSTELERESQPGLRELFEKMISIPFELNMKCNLLLQYGDAFELSMYGKDCFHKTHYDGAHEKDKDNGRKVTAIYFPGNSHSNPYGKMTVFGRTVNPYQKAAGIKDPKVSDKEIDMEGGTLVLVRTRDMPISFTDVRRKCFMITAWYRGPSGPGDQGEGLQGPGGFPPESFA